MRQRGQRPAYRAWLRKRPSLDRPEAPIRLLFALEAGATLVVVALILTAVAVVGLHQPATDPRDPPTAAALPATALPAEVPAGDDPSPGGSAGATTVTTTTSPATTPVAKGPAPAPSHTHPAASPSPTHQGTDPTTPAAAHCLRASHVLNTQWPGGLQAQFTVANCGSTAVNGWVVNVGFSGPVSIQVWSAMANGGSSNVDFGSVDYDSVVQPGASVTFGFNATWSDGGSRYITGCGVGYGRCS